MSQIEERVQTLSALEETQPDIKGKREQTVRDSFIRKFESDRNEDPGLTLKMSLRGLGQKKSYTGKRSIDLAIGVVAFAVFVILFPLIALGIKLNSRGPVLFKQPRTGKNGHQFLCYKFRTMHQLELRRMDGKPVVTQKNDRRIFWFGKLLRKTNLDELPQVLNVMKGDMSLIGPRPYPVKECAYWNSQFEDFYYRYTVRPGISGLAQVNGYRGGTLDTSLMRKRLDYDLIYVEKQSLWLDVKILYRTIFKMINFDTDAH
jgi:putative colanic acid biosysnthesis UDP-glucose lipid carrier transferase